MVPTQAAFSDLQHFHLSRHGDAREKAMWASVSSPLSNYEKFWQTFIVILTNRIDPTKHFGSDEWIRLRPSLPRQYEDLAMNNYSTFYYAASSAEQIAENNRLIALGHQYHPEIVFFYLEICIESVKRLHEYARALLLRFGVKLRLPKQPGTVYQTISAYRNAFTHDPILGRSSSHARELIPPPNKLPKTRRKNDFLRWSESEQIPPHQMVDCLKLQADLWNKLAGFLQETWQLLADAFLIVRIDDLLIKELNLAALLPIGAPGGTGSTANPFAASGSMIVEIHKGG